MAQHIDDWRWLVCGSTLHIMTPQSRFLRHCIHNVTVSLLFLHVISRMSPLSQSLKTRESTSAKTQEQIEKVYFWWFFLAVAYGNSFTNTTIWHTVDLHRACSMEWYKCIQMRWLLEQHFVVAMCFSQNKSGPCGCVASRIPQRNLTALNHFESNTVTSTAYMHILKAIMVFLFQTESLLVWRQMYLLAI